ncbi:MAG: phosphoribosyltransferase [Alphaproteobacteria bacterium]
MSRGAHESVLFSEGTIARRVKKLARGIASHPLKPDLAVPVLVGGFVFAADLLRALAREGVKLETEFIWLRSYGHKETPESVMVLKGPTDAARGRTTLIIDGVLQSGGTLARAKELLVERGAAAVLSAVLVVKPHQSAAAKADFIGFEAGPEFIFGYGMDCAGLQRGLPDIRILKR